MSWQRRISIASMVVVMVVGGVWIYGSIAEGKRAPDKVTIKACKKKKKPVTFDHKAHVKLVKKKCVTCHHQVKGKKPAKDRCSDCHKKAQGMLGTCQDKSKKKNPFHVACIGCHKKSGKAKAPTKCKACH